MNLNSLKQNGKLLVLYLKPQWVKVSLLVLLLILSTTIQIVNPLILGHFIDNLAVKGPNSTLLQITLLFLGVVVIGQLASAATAYFSEDVGLTATNQLRADLALHCLRLDLSFHHEHTSGELIERIDGDIAALANFFSQFIIRIIGSLILVCGILFLVFLSDWHLGLAMLSFAIVSLLLLKKLQGLSVPYFKAARQSMATLSSFWGERLSSLEDISANGAKTYVRGELSLILGTLLRKSRQSAMMANLIGTSTIGLAILCYTMIFTLGANLFYSGTLTLGVIYTILRYTNLLLLYLREIINQIDDLQRALAGLERIRELYYTKNKIEDTGKFILPKNIPDLEFAGVSFSYQEHEVLGNISFRLEAGKTLGLVGRTGSGKTTLTRLIFRFYEPTKGTIKLNGVDTRKIRLDSLRDHIGVVTQDVQLFHGTVRDNLTFFDRSIEDSSIHSALEELDLWRWYQTLPDGLDTKLISGGKTLSAGEAQLLAFTRILLKNPGFIILDEASARLDPATERLLDQAMTRLLKGRTAIIIAHRLSTLQRTDDILILEDGEITEHKTRKELILDNTSRFSLLLRGEFNTPPVVT